MASRCPGWSTDRPRASQLGGGRGLAGRTRSSWARELMSSLVNTLPRWYLTVRALMNSRAPISGFDSPSRASRAIRASWAVSSSARLGSALAGGLAGGRAAPAGRARRTPPSRSRRTCRGPCAAACARRRVGPHGAATRRRAGACARAPDAAACGSSRSIASRKSVLGGGALAQQGPRACLDSRAPRRCRRVGRLRQPLERLAGRRSRLLRGGRLDELGQRPFWRRPRRCSAAVVGRRA